MKKSTTGIPMDRAALAREAKHRRQSAERIVAEFVRTVAPTLEARDECARSAIMFQIEQTHARLKRLIPDEAALASLITLAEVSL